MSDNHYDVLGVGPDASRDELREAYRSRVDDLTAARDRKGVSERQLQENRDEVAKVRSAWNVLSDPFQRERYDAQVTAGGAAGGSAGGTTGGEVEIVDDSERPEVELTGWRKLMAPPPRPSAGANGSSQAPRPGAKQPTIVLPAGMQIAQGKTRGMALLFDLAVVLVILYLVNAIVPAAIQSDYRDKLDQISSVVDAGKAQDDIDDAREATADDEKGSQQDLQDAQKDFADAQKDFNDRQAAQDLDPVPLPHDTDELDDLARQLSGDVRVAQLVSALVTFALALAYLVPITVKTGSTFGMRGRKIKVVLVDGSPARLWPVVARFAIPISLGLAGTVAPLPILASLAPIAALGIVLWGYRDANGQGVHDKLARTIVVDA